MGKRKRNRTPQQQYWIQDCPNLVPLLPLAKEDGSNPSNVPPCESKEDAVPPVSTNDSTLSSLSEPDYHPLVKGVLATAKDDALILLLTQARLQDHHHALNTESSFPDEPVFEWSNPCPPHWLGCRRSNAASTTSQEDSIIKDAAESPEIYIKRIIQPRNPLPSRLEEEKKYPHVDLPNGDCGDGIVNPFPNTLVPDKYWAQRKRYFSKFDSGITLDAEGWFSVTPEVIANHIARRMIQSSLSGSDKPIIVLDSFVGMGANAIAFAQYPQVDLVVCVDTDVEKLYLAANNCAVYNIPKSKLLFLHGNACRVLESYRDGRRSWNPPNETTIRSDSTLPPDRSLPSLQLDEKTTDKSCGYRFGTYTDLPEYLDMIFLSPPWGGTNYETVGRRHYNLDCIKLCPDDALNETTADEMVNGEALLRMAVTALPPDQLNIAYFLPRNLNGLMFGLSCQHHCRGCLDLEQNIVNGKLKTITAYLQSRMCVYTEERRS